MFRIKGSTLTDIQGSLQHDLVQLIQFLICFPERTDILVALETCLSLSFCCSVAQLCPTLCDRMDCRMPGFPILHHLPILVLCFIPWCFPFWVREFKSCLLHIFYVTFLTNEILIGPLTIQLGSYVSDSLQQLYKVTHTQAVQRFLKILLLALALMLKFTSSSSLWQVMLLGDHTLRQAQWVVMATSPCRDLPLSHLFMTLAQVVPISLVMGEWTGYLHTGSHRIPALIPRMMG